MSPMDPKVVAERGAKIYAAKYQTAYEAEHGGMYVAIDVQSEAAFVAATPEDALRAAQAKSPGSGFYLVKIGSPGVFRVAHASPGGRGGNWVFGR
jgi:hypothetical protein